MRVLTEDALLVCNHQLGRITNAPSQNLVTIGRRRILVNPDPEGRPIQGCPNIGALIKPCTLTLKVEVGYSTWIRIAGEPICLNTVTGLTDGTPPGVVHYRVQEPGQVFVDERA